jgi:uncharacterized repeat protein (TIGR02543 family)
MESESKTHGVKRFKWRGWACLLTLALILCVAAGAGTAALAEEPAAEAVAATPANSAEDLITEAENEGAVPTGAAIQYEETMTAFSSTIYVGSDVTYSPIYPTLAEAVAAAQSGDEIIVTENLTMTARAYVADKHLTIKGIDPGITITRGTPFDTAVDGARGSFNAGMLEVATDVGDLAKTASVRLEDIIFDDRNNPEGFSDPIPQSTPSETGWANKIYDSTLSAYSGNAVITLGPGARLINTGGASAVRVAAGKVVMEPGSHVDGGKAKNDSFGVFWLNGGATLDYNTTFTGTISASNFIRIDGDAVTVNFGGKVTGSTLNGNIVYFQSGENSVANFSEQSELSGNALTQDIIRLAGSKNTVNFRGKANNNTSTVTNVSIIGSGGSNDVINVYGEMTGNITNGQLLNIGVVSNYQATLYAGSKLSGNRLGIGAIYVYGGSANRLDLYGEISNNVATRENGGAMYLIYGADVHMYDGAKISGNTSTGAGGGVYLNYTSVFTMHGGEISGNTASGAVYSLQLLAGNGGGGGVALVRNSKFIMNGGIIKDNRAQIGGGVFVSAKISNVSAGPSFIFNGGTISDNTATKIVSSGYLYGSDVAVEQLSDSFASSLATGHYIEMGKDAVIGEGFIGLGTGSSYGYIKAVYPLDKENANLRIGTILSARQSAIAADANTAHPEYAVRSSLWASTVKTAGTAELVLSYPSAIPENKRDAYEYLVAVQPLAEKAEPLPAGVISYAVPARESRGLCISVPLTDGAEGYAVVVFTKEKYDDLDLQVTHSGSGTFYAEDGGGDERPSPITLRRMQASEIADVLDSFTLYPAEGWRFESVTLTAGDGMVSDRTADADGGALSVSYYDLASGINTLCAVFAPIEYKIVYDTNGGSPAVIADKTNVNWTDTNLLPAENPVLAYHTFAGWDVSAGGKATPARNVQNTAKYSDLAADDQTLAVTLQAQWQINVHAVTYHGNGAESGSAPADPDSPYNAGVTVTVLDNTGDLSRAGHVFAGWATSAGGPLAYTAGGTFQITSDTDFYPVWRAEQSEPAYTVTFNGNGGTVAPGNETRVVSASAVTLGAIMPPDPARAEYTFLGWNTQADGSGTAFAASTPVTADITVYALWTPAGGGGSGSTGGGTTTPPVTPDPPDEPPAPAEPPEATQPPEPAQNLPSPSAPGHVVVPGENGNFIELGEDGVPLGEWHWDEPTQVWVFEEYPPPLANDTLPQTGGTRPGGFDLYGFLLLAFMLAAIGAGVLLCKDSITGTRKKPQK